MTGDEDALAEAMLQLLDDMGKDGLCVCRFAKAKARIAYEPFRNDDDGCGLMSIEEARRVVESCQ